MSELQFPLLNKKSSLQWKTSQRDVLLSNYDPFKFPADLNQAKKHGISRRICKLNTDIEIERCPCCMLPIKNQLIELTCNLEDLAFLGLAYPLYFVFLKAGFVLMFIHFLMIGIAQLILNLKNNQCQLLYIDTRICRISFINSFSLENLHVSYIQNILNIVFVFICIAMVQLIKFHTYLFKLKIQKNEISPSDYSILIKGLPPDITVYELQQFMYSQLTELGVDPRVIKIYLIYDVKQYQALYTKKRQIYQYKCSVNDKYVEATRNITQTPNSTKRKQRLAKAQSLFQQMGEADQIYDTIEQEIQKYEESLRILIQNLQRQQSIDQIQLPKKVKFSGKCIITLNHTQSASALIKHYQLTCHQGIIYRIQQTLRLDSSYMKKYKGQIIKIHKAPQPGDVVFANLGSQSYLKLKQRILVSLIVAVLIIMTCAFLAFGKKLFNQTKITSNHPLIYSFLASLLVAIFNSILGRLIRYFSLQQHFSTQSYYYYSVAVRVTIVYVMNMILASVMANYASFYILAKPAPTIYPGIELNFIGLMNDFFFINATNSLLAIIFVFFDYRYGYRLLKRLYITKYKHVTQSQANLTFENQPIDMAYKYSHGYRLLVFTAAVAPFIPNAILVSLGVMILIYIIDKYLFLRRWMCQYKLGYSLSSKMLRILNMYPLFLSFSNFMIMCIPIVSCQDPSYVHFYLSLSVFLYALVVSFTPTKIIQSLLSSLFNKRQNNSLSITYKQMQKQFIEDYSKLYPYFRVSKAFIDQETSSMSSGSSSPRRNKLLDETNKKLSQSVFGLLRDYIDHKRFTPKT